MRTTAGPVTEPHLHRCESVHKPGSLRKESLQAARVFYVSDALQRLRLAQILFIGCHASA